MLKRFSTFLAGFLACVLLTVAVTAASDVSVKAVLSNTFKLKLYGRDFTPKDSSGKYVKPLVYNGTVYLPVKIMGDALEEPVITDSKAKVVWIGGKIEVVPVNNTTMYENYSKTILTKDAGKLTTTETTYKWGVANEKTLSSVYYGCYLKPESKYKRFTASVFIDGEVKHDMVMEFRKNDKKGEVIKSITLKPGETTDIDIDIGGVSKLFIYSEIHGTITNLIVGEPAFRNDIK